MLERPTVEHASHYPMTQRNICLDFPPNKQSSKFPPFFSLTETHENSSPSERLLKSCTKPRITHYPSICCLRNSRCNCTHKINHSPQDPQSNPSVELLKSVQSMHSDMCFSISENVHRNYSLRISTYSNCARFNG